MKITAVIPARYASTRFPGKPLAKIGGIPMIQRVYERVLACKSIDQTIVATDDERIFSFVKSINGNVVMTSSEHESGTDRIAEVVAKIEADIIVNVQGDEPFIAIEQLDQLIQLFSEKDIQIATLARQIDEQADIHNPNVVKAVIGEDQRALYFSRSPIPFLRNTPAEEWLSKQKHFQHLGLYAYRKEVLLDISQLKPSNLEQMESLEQLRWLEAGYSIHVAITKLKSIGIDTPEDLEKAELSFS